jgi:hypothetical protein
MAKALELNADTLTVMPSVPQAAQVKHAQTDELRRGKAVPKVEREPLQVRWPTEDVKSVKLAAIQMDFPTVSDFMLACFHAYMKNQKA